MHRRAVALSTDLSLGKGERALVPYGAPGSIDSGHAHKASVVYYEGILSFYYTSPGRKAIPHRLTANTALSAWPRAIGRKREDDSIWNDWMHCCRRKPQPPSPLLWMKRRGITALSGEELVKSRNVAASGNLSGIPSPSSFCGRMVGEPGSVLPETRKRGMQVWILDDDKFPRATCCCGGFIGNGEEKVSGGTPYARYLETLQRAIFSGKLSAAWQGNYWGILAVPRSQTSRHSPSAEKDESWI